MNRLFHLLAALAAMLVALPLAASAQAPQSLTGLEKTKHFEIRFRPGSRAEASVDRVSIAAESDLALIVRELDVKDFKHTIKLYLYDDVPELQKLTGTPCAGYSVPLESHVPHDNDQTRLHELVHVVAEKFTEKGPEPRNLFFAEGLANAVLRFVDGIHVDCVAAHYRRTGRLPTIAEIHAIPDFYAWLAQHPGFNGYDVAGSWFRFLLDTQGVAKTRRYYCGVPAREAFGAELQFLEKAWHARLDKVTLRPGVVALLDERGGPTAALQKSPEAKLSSAILGPESEWKSLELAPIHGADPGTWERAPDGRSHLVISGVKSQGDWSVARVSDAVGDGILRCRIEPAEGCYGFNIQIGPQCQALLLKDQGAFLYAGSTAAARDPSPRFTGKPVEVVLRRRSGRAAVWIDGTLVADAPIDATPAIIGVGCIGGKARATLVSFRKL